MGANMGPTWGRQDPGGPHVGHVNLAIWGLLNKGPPGMYQGKGPYLTETRYICFHNVYAH